MTGDESACRVQVIGGIAFATTARAVFSARELTAACEQTMQQLDGRVPSVYVADFRATTWRLKTLHLDALFDGVEPEIQLPAALVVPECDFAMFRAHAWNVAQGGILRKVFTDYRAAVAWAQERSAITAKPRLVR
jgi:hypothetical protein